MTTVCKTTVTYVHLTAFDGFTKFNVDNVKKCLKYLQHAVVFPLLLLALYVST